MKSAIATWQSIPQIVWTASPDGGLDYYNQRWFDYTGLNLEQTKGWGWQPVLHPDDLQTCTDRWSESIATGESIKRNTVLNVPRMAHIGGILAARCQCVMTKARS